MPFRCTARTFNRTKVELKSIFFVCTDVCVMLLIVPKWNWNKGYYQERMYRYMLLIVPKWNWNWISTSLFALLSTFNRTKVELKFKYLERAMAGGYLLIVPKWNWNKQQILSKNNRAKLLIVPKWNWNQYKTRSQQSDPELLIVPKWNWNLSERQFSNDIKCIF